MRCKNCKKKVENENLLRCPYCGKPLPKKKVFDRKKIALTASFIAVSLLFFVFSFFGFFFKCSYYSSGVMIIGIILFAVCIPFVLGGFSGITKKQTLLFATVMSLPFVANWIMTFIVNGALTDYGGFCTVYYWAIFSAVIICDVLLILSFAQVIKKTKFVSYISLGLTVLIFGLTLVYFIPANVVKPVGICVIAFQNIMPSYMAFYTLNKDE